MFSKWKCRFKMITKWKCLLKMICPWEFLLTAMASVADLPPDPPFLGVALSPITWVKYPFVRAILSLVSSDESPLCFEKYFPCWTFLFRIERCFLLSADQPPPLPLVALSLKASVAVPQWPIGPPATFSHPQNTRLKYPPSNTSQIPPSTLPSKTTFFPRVSQVKIVSFLFCSKMTFRKNIAKVTTDPSYWVFCSENPLHWNLQIGPLALVARTICTYLLQIQPTLALIANLITRWCHLALDNSNLWWFLKFE